MKQQLTFVVLALILLTSCQHRQTTVRKQPPPPPPTIPAPKQDDTAVVALRQAVALTKELTLKPDSALPDALLNRTQCFVVGLAQRAVAVSTCRTASAPYAWSAPELVSLENSGPMSGNALLFLLSDRAAETLRTGVMDFSQFSISSGKTQKETPLLTDRDLGYDVVTYLYSRPTLSGTAVNIRGLKRWSTSEPTPGGGASASIAPVPATTGEYLNWVRSYFNAITPTGIIIHHTAIIPSTNRVPSNLAEVEQYHAERGLDIECFGREYHVAYHYLILPDGKVKEGRPERCEGAHARGYNSYLGISLVGDFSSTDNPTGSKGRPEPSPQQLKALVKLTRQLQRRYNIPVQRILRHSDVESTVCPGERFRFKNFLSAVEQPVQASR